MQPIIVCPDSVDGVTPRREPQKTPLKTVYRRATRRKTAKAIRRYERILRTDRAADRIVTAAKASAIAVALALMVTGAAHVVVMWMGI